MTESESYPLLPRFCGNDEAMSREWGGSSRGDDDSISVFWMPEVSSFSAPSTPPRFSRRGVLVVFSVPNVGPSSPNFTLHPHDPIPTQEAPSSAFCFFRPPALSPSLHSDQSYHSQQQQHGCREGNPDSGSCGRPAATKVRTTAPLRLGFPCVESTHCLSLACLLTISLLRLDIRWRTPAFGGVPRARPPLGCDVSTAAAAHECVAPLAPVHQCPGLPLCSTPRAQAVMSTQHKVFSGIFFVPTKYVYPYLAYVNPYLFVRGCFCAKTKTTQGAEGYRALHRLRQEQGPIAEVLEHQGSRTGEYTHTHTQGRDPCMRSGLFGDGFSRDLAIVADDLVPGHIGADQLFFGKRQPCPKRRFALV